MLPRGLYKQAGLSLSTLTHHLWMNLDLLEFKIAQLLHNSGGDVSNSQVNLYSENSFPIFFQKGKILFFKVSSLSFVFLDLLENFWGECFAERMALM